MGNNNVLDKIRLVGWNVYIDVGFKLRRGGAYTPPRIRRMHFDVYIECNFAARWF